MAHPAIPCFAYIFLRRDISYLNAVSPNMHERRKDARALFFIALVNAVVTELATRLAHVEHGAAS